ncbi:hypothetical protein D3C71_1864810 [compost metagenome]
MLRVVRLSRRTPSRCSNCTRRLETAGGVRFNSRAAAARLPTLMSKVKNANSDTGFIINLRELMS